MVFSAEDFLRIALAILVGGLVGAEREYREKAAGFRTITLITLGSTLFTIFSLKIGGPSNPDRIAANIITGIGFLGAGAILRGEHGVTGITTAATIWLAAALGMGIGGGYYLITIASTPVVLLVLWLFVRIENWIGMHRSVRDYEVIVALNTQKLETIDAIFRSSGLHLKAHRRLKIKEGLSCHWTAYGPPEKHDLLVNRLLEDPEVKELKY